MSQKINITVHFGNNLMLNYHFHTKTYYDDERVTLLDMSVNNILFYKFRADKTLRNTQHR